MMFCAELVRNEAIEVIETNKIFFFLVCLALVTVQLQLEQRDNELARSFNDTFCLLQH
jgi:hypothetical protein